MDEPQHAVVGNCQDVRCLGSPQQMVRRKREGARHDAERRTFCSIPSTRRRNELYARTQGYLFRCQIFAEPPLLLDNYKAFQRFAGFDNDINCLVIITRLSDCNAEPKSSAMIGGISHELQEVIRWPTFASNRVAVGRVSPSTRAGAAAHACSR